MVRYTPKRIRAFSRSCGVFLRRALSQHILTNEFFLERIVKEAHLHREVPVLEIGAGTGRLTWLLVRSSKTVVAVELDPRFKPALQAIARSTDNLHLIIGDILKLKLVEILAPPPPHWRVVANIPYSITSPLIVHLLQNGHGFFDSLILLVQKEVAQRICSSPGSRYYGALTLFVRIYSEAELLFVVPRTAFSPQPRVDSALVRLKIRKTLPISCDLRVLLSLIRHSFQHRRKTMRNCLRGFSLLAGGGSPEEILTQAGISPLRRPETLSLEDFELLAKIVEAHHRREVKDER